MNQNTTGNAVPPFRINRFPFLDNIYTTIFTPAEHQVSLLDVANKQNIVVCLSPSGKDFMVAMMVKEHAHRLRGPLPQYKRCFILANSASSVEHYREIIQEHTSVQATSVLDATGTGVEGPVWEQALVNNHVLVTLVDTFTAALRSSVLDRSRVALLITDECHLALRRHPCRELMSLLSEHGPSDLRILGLAAPVLARSCEPATLERRLRRLEAATGCATETSSSLALLGRHSCRPEEAVVEWESGDDADDPHAAGRSAASAEIRRVAEKAMAFLRDHEHRPEDLYGPLDYDDEEEEEESRLPVIPDPTVVPLAFLADLLDILATLGPWCADRAAWFFMKELRKHKDKTPYERHYLLLSVAFTVMEQTRSICDYHFRDCADERQRLARFSGPALLRLQEILRAYRPSDEEMERIKQRRLLFASQNRANAAPAPTVDSSSGGGEAATSCVCSCHLPATTAENGQAEICDHPQPRPETASLKSEGVSTNLRPPDATKCCSLADDEATCDQKRSTCCNPGGQAEEPPSICDATKCAIPANEVEKPPESDCTCGASLYSSLRTAAAANPGFHHHHHGGRHGGWRSGRWHGNNQNNQNRRPAFASDDPNSLWGVVFVERRYAACIVNMYLKELSKHEPDFLFLFPNFIMGQRQLPLAADGDPRDVQLEHRKQEEVLRRFRLHECNVLVATAVIESGVDLPRCNLVVRLDRPRDYTSYAQSKGLAKAVSSRYLLLVERRLSARFREELGKYRALEEILLSRCHGREVPIDEAVHLKTVDLVYPPFFTNPSLTGTKVTMSTAMTVVNRYCARLPSDTFTRLVPRCVLSELNDGRFQASLSLPINSPIKQNILGSPMPNEALAKMSAALETCKTLHGSGELDDQLMPMGKLSATLEREVAVAAAEAEGDEEKVTEGSPRPGTTKRRQYYNKRIALAFRDCLPRPDTPAHLYRIRMKLTCPIPDEQNIRGRQIYEPASTPQGFGLLTSKEIPPICSFPVFTRSGEVTVRLIRVASGLRLSENELEQLSTFHRYTFANVLRLEKYPMRYDHEGSENSLLIVPLNRLMHRPPAGDSLAGLNGTVGRSGKGEFGLDWPFVRSIVAHKDAKPQAVPESERRRFCHQDYQDAVVMPWYRNLDQPQFFYVAEVCRHLSPRSDFPDDDFETFEKYYLRKYGLHVQDPSQPLLDVDHTSARLNLLTPRYVNRKGVALPTSSDQTKRSRCENLQQKQILVPELCAVHPFSASLWRKAVCLPCVLYRLNCLLLAEEIRVRVAREIGLGRILQHRWPALNFGWSLADIIRARRLAVEEGKTKVSEEKEVENVGETTEDQKVWPVTGTGKGTAPRKGNGFTIGTWSNEMAAAPDDPATNGAHDSGEDDDDDDDLLPEDLMLLNCNSLFGKEGKSAAATDGSSSPRPPDDGHKIRYGSPSNFECGWDLDNDVLEADVMNIHRFGAGGFEGNRSSFSGQSSSGSDLASCRRSAMAMSDDDDDEEDESEDTGDDAAGDDGQTGYWKADGVANGALQSAGEQGRGTLHATAGDDKQEPPEFDWDVVDVEDDREVTDADLEEVLVGHVRQAMQKIRFVGAKEKLVLERANEVTLNGLPVAPKVVVEVEPATTVVPLDGAIVGDKEKGAVTSLDPPNVIKLSKEDICVGDVEPSCDRQESKLANGEIYSDDGSSSEEEEEEVVKTAAPTSAAEFSFDEQPDLASHPGPSPSVLLQSLTMSNANDGINLERLETIGDSFLKHAITSHLFCAHPHMHEGRLSHLRSKQVSNLRLYRLGRRKGLGCSMVATKFEPNDNWLPPGYLVPPDLEQALIDSGVPAGYWNPAEMEGVHLHPNDRPVVHATTCPLAVHQMEGCRYDANGTELPAGTCYIPYNLMTQHSVPDKSIADCVEAQIGAYLTSCGPQGALLFMSWLGIDVLPRNANGSGFGPIVPPPSPLKSIPLPAGHGHGLDQLLHSYDDFESQIGYRFRDRSYLLQAFTHASYHYNRLTDCYQRLEFLGDAVLDYLITRHLYEDKRQHSPGTLTDLRSALVNNAIFATLAVRYNFHKYFKALCPNLFMVIDRFIRLQKENDHRVNEEYYFMEEEACDEVEDIEVPKALGDVFESVAGAIYLDSGLSLDTVWKVYYAMMKPEIELFSTSVPKSPIRELLEKEPETAKFGKPERTLEGKVRVTVEIFGKGRFTALGRNYRIAKCTAAKHALKALRKMQSNVTNGHPAS